MGKRLIPALFASSCFMALAGACVQPAHAAGADIQIVADDIGGVVTSAKGPEAGVWVIAETGDLPTRFIKEVVTDDQGRYVLPQLPNAKYKVWVRGYGLVDSKPVEASPGKLLNLTAVVAPDAKAAAQYYPANYWYAMIRPPAASEFPGTGAEGNGIAPVMKTQQQWLANMKECLQCHELGDLATRNLGDNSPEGWAQRVQQARGAGDPSMGDQGQGYTTFMQFLMARYGRHGPKMFADWTDRIAKGALPETPSRPTGVERNIVLTLWDWGHGSYFHDEVATDRRDPTVNAYGPVYGIATNIGKIGILDPVKNSYSEVDIPNGEKGFAHSVMMDQKGRTWYPDLGPAFQPKLAPPARPTSCTDEISNKFAKYFPVSGKEVTLAHMYDPATKKVTTLSLCSRSGSHLYFMGNKDNTLAFSGNTVMGWIDVAMWDKTHDLTKAEGWCPIVIDSKEKGITKAALSSADDVAITPDRTKWNEPGKPADPHRDTRVEAAAYGLGINPVDNSVWLADKGASAIIRVDRGAHPPETCKSEIYQPPKLADGSLAAFSPHDLGFDSKGIAWVAFTSGQVGRFDRGKCKVMTGSAAVTGQQCAEGWTIYDAPGPRFGGVDRGYASAGYPYQTFVDLFNTFGLGKDVPMVPDSNADSLIALMPDTGKWVNLRVPYPMGFYSRWLDGRIDDAKAGWKGRGLWATFSTVPTWHQEGGEDANPELVHFQLRSDPLAH